MNTFERRWIFMLAFLVAVISIVYVYSHLQYRGAREVQLTAEQINVIRSIPDSSVTAEEAIESIVAFLTLNPDLHAEGLQKQLQSMGLSTFMQTLPTLVLQVDSCFWLVGKWLYWEIIFWTLFGVLANALFHSAQRIRRKQFRRAEIVVYISKLLYAPFVVLVIFLSQQALVNSGDLAHLNAGLGAIVLSFVLGFFSGRAIGLLNKLKDLLLPRMAATNEQATLDKPREDTPSANSENPFCQLNDKQQEQVVNIWLAENKSDWASDTDRVQEVTHAINEKLECHAIVVQLQPGITIASMDFPGYVVQFYEGFDYEIPVIVQESKNI